MNVRTRGRSPRNSTGRLLLLLVALGSGGGHLAGQELAPVKASDQRPFLDHPAAQWARDYTNWVELSIGNFFVDGQSAAFQRRHQLPGEVFGGVERFHWENPVGATWLLRLDGRALFDNHDYGLQFDLRDPEKGFVRGGYREFRTWYDRHGGFFPPGNVWLTPFDREASIDRGEAWVEGGLTLPDLPQFTFRYTHQFRDGTKDSTVWGDYNANQGIAGAAADLRSIIPSFWDIDEQRDIFQGDLRHVLGQTDLGIGLRYELSDQDNRRQILRRVGESPPTATPGAERALTQQDEVDTDLFNVHAFTQSRIHEKVLLTSGYSFTTLDTDISGSRIYGADFEAVFDPTFARRQPFDEGFLNLEGGSRLNQYVVNVNLLCNPWNHISLLPSVRVERLDEEGGSDFLETTVGAAPALTTVTDELQARNNRDFLDVSESLEARYTGLRNWFFYTRGEWLQGDGTLRERETEVATGTLALLRNTDSERFTQKYSVGANWYPLRRLNFGAQYHKIRNNDYEHHEDSNSNALTSGSRYPAFLEDQDFDTDDMNVRVTWRPLRTLTLVTRYDFQLSTIDTWAPFLGEIQSAEVTSHIIGESVSWSPLARLYLQGSLNYVLDETETPANSLSGPLQNLVLKSENNYWNATFLAGFTLNKKTDLQGQYFYYRADNYQNNAPVSQPYGMGDEDHGVTATLLRQITPSLRWTLKYGYFTHHDQTYGGNTDYDAHLVYSSVQYRF